MSNYFNLISLYLVKLIAVMRKFFTFLILILNIQYFFSQQTVFVKGKEKGNGLLIERKGECFVITPHHVVFEYSKEILISDKDRVNSKGILIQVFDPDLAIIRIESGGVQYCKNITVKENFSSIVNSISSGFLEYIDEFGTANLIHADITAKDETSFAIQPKNSIEQISKGMSGSAFYVNYKNQKILLGMLMSIESDFKTGYIYQIDDLLKTTSSFFNIKKEKSIGVLIIDQDSRKNASKVTNEYVKLLGKNNYITISNVPKIEFIYSEFDNITSGSFSKKIPIEITNILDELVLGELSFNTEKNQFDMFVTKVVLESNYYSTKDFNFQKNISFKAKGVSYNEKESKSLAIEDLFEKILEKVD